MTIDLKAKAKEISKMMHEGKHNGTFTSQCDCIQFIYEALRSVQEEAIEKAAQKFKETAFNYPLTEEKIVEEIRALSKGDK